MANNRSSLPKPGSGIPKKSAIALSTKHKIIAEPKLSTPAAKLQVPEVSGQSNGSSPDDPKPRDSKKRLSRMIPIAVTSNVLPSTPNASSRPDSEHGSTSSSALTSSSTQESMTTESSSSTGPVSLYHEPHVAEPCVRDALLHVLEPCGHRIMTSKPEPCGSNCMGSDWVFANAITEDKFACAICISRYVQELYQEKKALFIPSLDALEKSLGGFKDGWKEARIAKMERVWQNDALEEQMALETLGRLCEAIATEPEEESGAWVTIRREVLMTKKPVESVPSATPPVRKDSKMGRLEIPMRRPMSMRKSQLPAPSSSKLVKEKKTLECERGIEKPSRLLVGPRPSRRQTRLVKIAELTSGVANDCFNVNK